MKPNKKNILLTEDIAIIDHTIASQKIGSGQASALIEAAGALSMQGRSVDGLIQELMDRTAESPSGRTAQEIRDRETAYYEAARATAKKAQKDVRTCYRAVIDRFLNEMADIDHAAGTYAKLRYEDVRQRPVRVHSETTKPNGYVREIEIDEIVLSGDEIVLSGGDE